jgi:arginine repressor
MIRAKQELEDILYDSGICKANQTTVKRMIMRFSTC